MINLDNLATLHDNEGAIHRHKRILEELFYLCINPTFIETIENKRAEIQGMIDEVDLDFPITLEGAIQIRRNYLTDRPEYWQLLQEVSEKHRYYHPSFTRNYTKIITDEDVSNRFNIIENIIFFNNPIPDERPLEHFNNRSGFMEIGYDEVSKPYVKVQFDLGTTKIEMINIIEKDFSKIKKLLKNEYNIPETRYRADDNLRAKNFIHKNTQLGESNTTISVKLENSGLVPSQDNLDYIRLHKQRMAKAAERFDAND
jgi:hypothetical protein